MEGGNQSFGGDAVDHLMQTSSDDEPSYQENETQASIVEAQNTRSDVTDQPRMEGGDTSEEEDSSEIPAPMGFPPPVKSGLREMGDNEWLRRTNVLFDVDSSYGYCTDVTHLCEVLTGGNVKWNFRSKVFPTSSTNTSRLLVDFVKIKKEFRPQMRWNTAQKVAANRLPNIRLAQFTTNNVTYSLYLHQIMPDFIGTTNYMRHAVIGAVNAAMNMSILCSPDGSECKALSLFEKEQKKNKSQVDPVKNDWVSVTNLSARTLLSGFQESLQHIAVQKSTDLGHERGGGFESLPPCPLMKDIQFWEPWCHGVWDLKVPLRRKDLILGARSIWKRLSYIFYAADLKHTFTLDKRWMGNHHSSKTEDELGKAWTLTVKQASVELLSRLKDNFPALKNPQVDPRQFSSLEMFFDSGIVMRHSDRNYSLLPLMSGSNEFIAKVMADRRVLVNGVARRRVNPDRPGRPQRHDFTNVDVEDPSDDEDWIADLDFRDLGDEVDDPEEDSTQPFPGTPGTLVTQGTVVTPHYSGTPESPSGNMGGTPRSLVADNDQFDDNEVSAVPGVEQVFVMESEVKANRWPSFHSFSHGNIHNGRIRVQCRGCLEEPDIDGETDLGQYLAVHLQTAEEVNGHPQSQVMSAQIYTPELKDFHMKRVRDHSDFQSLKMHLRNVLRPEGHRLGSFDESKEKVKSILKRAEELSLNLHRQAPRGQFSIRVENFCQGFQVTGLHGVFRISAPNLWEVGETFDHQQLAQFHTNLLCQQSIMPLVKTFYDSLAAANQNQFFDSSRISSAAKLALLFSAEQLVSQLGPLPKKGPITSVLYGEMKSLGSQQIPMDFRVPLSDEERRSTGLRWGITPDVFQLQSFQEHMSIPRAWEFSAGSNPEGTLELTARQAGRIPPFIDPGDVVFVRSLKDGINQVLSYLEFETMFLSLVFHFCDIVEYQPNPVPDDVRHSPLDEPNWELLKQMTNDQAKQFMKQVAKILTCCYCREWWRIVAHDSKTLKKNNRLLEKKHLNDFPNTVEECRECQFEDGSSIRLPRPDPANHMNALSGINSICESGLCFSC